MLTTRLSDSTSDYGPQPSADHNAKHICLLDAHCPRPALCLAGRLAHRAGFRPGVAASQRTLDPPASPDSIRRRLLLHRPRTAVDLSRLVGDSALRRLSAGALL